MLRGAMEAKERVGLMLNVKKGRFEGGPFGPARVEASDDFYFERSRLAGGQHRDRRTRRMGSNSAAEGSEGTGHRGISAEQGGDVMRILSGRAAEARVKHLAARSIAIWGG